MQVTLDIPDSLAGHLGPDPGRAALEALVVDAYQRRILFEGEIKRLLGYETRMQVHELLARHNVPLHYDAIEYAKDLDTLRKLDEAAPQAA